MTTAAVRERDTFADLDDAVLFDVVREAGNRLLGRLLHHQEIARASGRVQEAMRLAEEESEVAEEVASVWGREELLRRFRAWSARFDQLGQQ